jgi:hypothetical protein
MQHEPKAIQPFTAMDAMTLTAALGSSVHKPFSSAQGRASTRPARCKRMKEVVFEISQDSDKCYCATCRKENISTKAESWEKLRVNIRQAVRAFSLDRYSPHRIHLHFVRDETLVLR